MSFKKYPSIENHYREKFIQSVRNSSDVLFGVYEKIDGQNIQIEMENNQITGVFSRNGVDISNTPSQGLERAKSLALEISNLLMSKNFIIYGELFGNNIQKNIKYFKDNNKETSSFLIFDIYDNDNHKFLTACELDDLSKKLDFAFIKPYKVNLTLDEALEFDVENTFSLHSQNANTKIEGVIIKPMNEDIWLGSHTRLIIKKKADKFKEIVKVKKTIPVSQITVPNFEDYINENRISSVYSKQNYKIPNEIGILINDVIADAIEEYGKMEKELNESEIKSVQKAFSHKVAFLIKSMYL